MNDVPRLLLGISIGLALALAISFLNRPHINVPLPSPTSAEFPGKVPPAQNQTQPPEPSSNGSLSAAGAFDAIAAGLRDDRPVVLWEALPVRHQGQVREFLAACAASMDDASWRDAFGAIEAVGETLTTRPEFVRGNRIAMTLLAIASEDRSPEVWFRLGPLVREVGRSALGEVAELAALDVAALLEGEGRTLSRALPDLSLATRGSLADEIATRDWIAATRASLLQQEEKRALLRLEAPDQPPADRWFVRDEDKWLPESFERDWTVRMNELRERCGSLAHDGKLAGWVATLASARPALSQLAQAESQREFDSGMGSIAEAAGPQLAQVLLDSMLGSSGLAGVQLNIGSMKYRAESGAPAAEGSGP